MNDFIIEGEIIKLILLNAASIEERVIWNTTVIEWKMEESGMINAESVDENSYRLKKGEINSFINSLIGHYHPEDAADVQDILKNERTEAGISGTHGGSGP